MKPVLQDDKMCYVCGPENPEGFKLRFEQPEKGRLTSQVVFSKVHQGYKDIVHGGMIAMVLDEMMVNTAWLDGTPVVTGELTVRLKKPVNINQKILLEGRIEREEARVIYASAEARDAGGEVLASATARCVKIKHKALPEA